MFRERMASRTEPLCHGLVLAGGMRTRTRLPAASDLRTLKSGAVNSLWNCLFDSPSFLLTISELSVAICVNLASGVNVRTWKLEKKPKKNPKVPANQSLF